MRLRNIKNKNEILDNSIYLVKDYKNYKGNCNKLFGNNNKIMLEIGIGKGKFILENAILNKHINYIGIEKSDVILAKAIKNIEMNSLDNIKLIRCDAKELIDIFYNEIDTIYLNFSDPWPKSRHEKRRLTSKEFLSIYDDIFKESKHIILKTDNRLFFEYSVISLSEYGYKINDISLDLHNSDIKNITTEYEDKFVSEGKLIYRIDCVKL